MLSVSEVHYLIDARVLPLTPQSISLQNSSGLILAEPIRADSDIPLSDLSAMDGYAISIESDFRSFQIIGTILPGEAPLLTPQGNEALKVFTGSSLPAGVKILMQENVLRQENSIIVQKLERVGHVRHRASIARQGDPLLEQGTLLSPASLAILASVGIIYPCVIPRASVAHLTTGSEVISPDQIPRLGQVRNTNAPLIRALVEEVGAIYRSHQHCDESLASGLSICTTPDFANADLLLISGGSSGGDHDHTAEIIKTLGFELCCHTVRVRPGKPFLLGMKGRQIAIGLPGNPASHFVSFHLFVKRVLQRLMGYSVSPCMKGILTSGVHLKEGQLETYWPSECCHTDQGLGISVKNWMHSGHLTALAGVNALIRVSANEPVPKDGEIVEFLSCGNSVINVL